MMHAAIAIVLFGAGLTAGAPALAADAGKIAVQMKKETFVPAKATAAPGTTITWTNTDSVPHSVTADDKRFDSGPILPGKTFQWTVSGGGPVPYHCIFHPSMTAVVDVGAATAK